MEFISISRVIIKRFVSIINSFMLRIFLRLASIGVMNLSFVHLLASLSKLVTLALLLASPTYHFPHFDQTTTGEYDERHADRYSDGHADTRAPAIVNVLSCVSTNYPQNSLKMPKITYEYIRRRPFRPNSSRLIRSTSACARRSAHSRGHSQILPWFQV